MKRCKIKEGYHPKIGKYTYCEVHQDWLNDLVSNKPLPPCVLGEES